jgi:hypothetical protein
MFRLGTANLSKAIERARSLHPKVRCVMFGLYEVTGSKGNTYLVRCWKERTGKFVDCSCHTKDGVACKHGVAAIPLHSFIAQTQLAIR